MTPKVVLLYTRRATEIDEYEQLIRAAELPIELRVCRTPVEARQNIVEADIVFGVHLPPEIYAEAKQLRWIQSMWAGVEGLVSAPLPPGVTITKPWGVFKRFISQYVFGYLLADYIKLRQGYAQQAVSKWEHYRIELVRGKRLGIAGLGDIGSEIARIGKSFEMEIWGLNQNGQPHPFADRVFPTNAVGEFAAGINVLVITLPATPKTRGLFNREVLWQLQPDLLLINVGRGVVIDEIALAELLEQQRIRGAVIDVFTEEPLPSEHPFWRLPNCIVTPHVGGPSLPTDITQCFLENFQRFSVGQPLLGQIDLERGY
ncbi:MAG: D-2-hydroxyacid dehydrogenase [Acidobacteriota bacterium]